MMRNEETYVTSGTHVHFALYLPRIVIRYRAIVQIHHGLEEYNERYHKFASFLANHGYVVITADFPGHGQSLNNFNQGQFCELDGTVTLVDDVERLRDIVATRYPSLPYFMLGYQLGSVVLKKYIALFGQKIDGCILLGTNGQNPFRHYRAAFNLSSLFVNDNAKNNFIHQLIHSRFGKSSNAVDYLSHDSEAVASYYDDPFNHFAYTNKSYKEIMRLLDQTGSYELMKNIPPDLPILLLSGKDDYFGEYGKGVKWLHTAYKKLGIKDVEMNIYPKMRMDILHEVNHRDVYWRIVDWLEEHTYY